jgi:thiamine pyrophosphokinase
MGPDAPTFLLEFPTLAIDGGGHFASHLDIWVGDSDSLKKEIHPVHSFHFPERKDASDLALGLELFASGRPYKLHFWGFRGGRSDHELFNLGEGLKFLGAHPGSQIVIYGPDEKVYFHLVGEGHWNFTHEGLFSLGTVKKTMVKLTGACEYPILKATHLPSMSSLGLSNVAHGQVKLEAQGAMFICFPEGK